LLQDAALRKKVGEGARMRIGEDFSISTMVCAHQKLYDELLKRQVAYARE